MRFQLRLLSLFCIALLAVCLISSADTIDADRVHRLSFNHLLYISDINTNPQQIYPGQQSTLNFKIENTGDQYIKDVRVNIVLPNEIAPYEDITKRKIAYMDVGEIQNISFNLAALPSTEDGIYKLSVNMQYLNWIGDEREENDTISIIVGSSPKLLVELASSDIYRGSLMGTVKVKVINDNPGNVKFLKVKLGESSTYTILGSNMDYIGDLNSDDFSEVSFKLSLKDDSDSIELPVALSYKDALNKDYTQEAKILFNVPTAKEAGITKSYTAVIVIVIIVLAIAYFFYRRRSKNMAKQKKAATFNFNTKF
jgi:hypothetical protein